MASPELSKADSDQFRERVSAANSILCVGNGPTGCETSAWIKEAHPGKKVGMCMRGKTILP
jgi:NADH dehydrogenase FAD-containing subunit